MSPRLLSVIGLTLFSPKLERSHNSCYLTFVVVPKVPLIKDYRILTHTHMLVHVGPYCVLTIISFPEQNGNKPHLMISPLVIYHQPTACP